MVSRLLALACVAGCSFTPGEARPGTKVDAPSGSGSADAMQPLIDAPLDAKVFLDAASVTGSITITATPYGSSSHDVNLSTEGITDWAHWGLVDSTTFDHKVGGTSISNLAPVTVGRFTGAPLTATWIVGTPDATATATTTGVGVRVGASMTFTVPAGKSPKTMHWYGGLQQASARLDVSLSDSSAAAQQMTYSNMNATDNVEYTITYNAASAGQTLTVSWTDLQDFNSGNGFIALMSATLE